MAQPTPQHGRVVKIIVLQFYEMARKEIGALILSDEHPNIVRCFAMEEDTEFVYLALERCRHVSSPFLHPCVNDQVACIGALAILHAHQNVWGKIENV